MFLGARRRVGLPELHRADFERVLQEAPERTTFILFDGGSAEERLAARALADAQSAHAAKLRAFRAPAGEFADYVEAQTRARRAFDTYDFQRRPCLGVYRGGRLLTTFSPRRVFFDPRLQLREARTQLEICIEKFCYYDPQLVREQTNIAEAMKHEAQQREQREAAGGDGPRPAAGPAGGSGERD
jgi:hypothetical protein